MESEYRIPEYRTLKNQIVILRENGVERVFGFQLDMNKLKSLNTEQRRTEAVRQAKLCYASEFNCDIVNLFILTIVNNDGFPHLTNNNANSLF